jgi:hypothetical protein
MEQLLIEVGEVISLRFCCIRPALILRMEPVESRCFRADGFFLLGDMHSRPKVGHTVKMHPKAGMSKVGIVRNA